MIEDDETVVLGFIDHPDLPDRSGRLPALLLADLNPLGGSIATADDIFERNCGKCGKIGWFAQGTLPFLAAGEFCSAHLRSDFGTHMILCRADFGEISRFP